jgi:hypothetical protein
MIQRLCVFLAADCHSLTELAGPVAKVTVGLVATPEPHGFEPAQWFGCSDKHGLTATRGARHNVEAEMHAIDEVDVTDAAAANIAAFRFVQPRKA